MELSEALQRRLAMRLFEPGWDVRDRLLVLFCVVPTHHTTPHPGSATRRHHEVRPGEGEDLCDKLIREGGMPLRCLPIKSLARPLTFRIPSPS